MTQLEYAKKNRLTSQMREVARAEGIAPDELIARIREGRVVIPVNRKHKVRRACGIGLGLRTKVNANIGTSVDSTSIKLELLKLEAAISSGADTVMDLSTGGDIAKIRRAILKDSTVPVGTVPVYEAACLAARKYGSFYSLKEDELFSVLEAHAKDGVDFMTIHAGVTRESIARMKKEGRTAWMVSRGGTLLAGWMRSNDKENPFYQNFDRVLDIARDFDVTLSLGDAMRPGAIVDASDRGQFQELILLGELARRARDFGVQVMIEGPGHLPLNEIESNVIMEKRLCEGAPFYVLGPLVTDIGCGYDHITGAIGGAVAGMYGADFLCYVTPSEHLRLPSVSDVREGVIASRIAAHAADITKGIKKATDWDFAMARARKDRDWKRQVELSLDPARARKLHRASSSYDACTMCGTYCPMRLSEEI